MGEGIGLLGRDKIGLVLKGKSWVANGAEHHHHRQEWHGNTLPWR